MNINGLASDVIR